MQVNGGMEPDADVGPMITPEAKQRAEALIQSAIDQVRGVRSEI
jgi:malonate-semialdehyde dehydrogenase (acetylating)/methylmalonate-semialdehyde dehydrogenase